MMQSLIVYIISDFRGISTCLCGQITWQRYYYRELVWYKANLSTGYSISLEHAIRTTATMYLSTPSCNINNSMLLLYSYIGEIEDVCFCLLFTDRIKIMPNDCQLYHLILIFAQCLLFYYRL